jgi:hypothetical protein
MHIHTAPKASAVDPNTPYVAPEVAKLKTGSVCPRCALPKIRMFDSQAEFGRAMELKLLVRAGVIENLEYQVNYPLHVVDKDGRKVKIYSYVADFTYTELPSDQSTEDAPHFTVEDVKPLGGLVTDVFEMKRKHFEVEYGFPIKIVERG